MLRFHVAGVFEVKDGLASPPPLSPLLRVSWLCPSPVTKREFSCSALIHPPTHQHTTTAAATAAAANTNEANSVTSPALRCFHSLSGGGRMEPKLD